MVVHNWIQTSWNCEDGKCVKVVGKGGVGDFATLQECEDSNCEERARPTGTGVRKHDRDMAKRRPYSPKYRDMRGSRNESVRRQKLIDTSKFQTLKDKTIFIIKRLL